MDRLGANEAERLFNLHDKVIFITGAAGGIGAGIARAFAGSGARLVLADGLEAATSLAETLRPARALPAELDVREKSSCVKAVDAALSEFGRLDVLINCAGVNTRMRPEAYPEAVWDEIVDINLKGSFLMCQAAHAALKDGGGKIVNVGSILSLVSNAVTAPYSASKGGVLQLTRSLACAWAEDAINVNVILPGWIDTALSRQARTDIEGHAERVVATTPLGRWGEPTDLVGAAVFFSTSASDFITGASLVVDGGVTAHV